MAFNDKNWDKNKNINCALLEKQKYEKLHYNCNRKRFGYESYIFVINWPNYIRLRVKKNINLRKIQAV